MDSQRMAGFSLLELLITLALIALLAVLAAPSLSSLVERNRTLAITEQLQAQLMLSRTQSVVHQRDTVLCGSAAGFACDGDWSRGWLSQQSHDGQMMNHRHDLDGGRRVVWRGGLQAVIRFDANGTAPSGNGRFLICDAAQQVAWQLVLNRQGRVRRVQGLERGQNGAGLCL